MVTRRALAKGTAAGALLVLVLAGAAGLYYYTMAPATPGRSSSTVSTSSTITPSASQTASAGQGPAGGACTMNAQGQCETPQGAWADYLGYIPAGYVLAPHYAIAPTYPCPAGMNSQQCSIFKASCGNGVCDPNESCQTCPIDCGINGQLTCDPYTGRPGAPISVCQLGGAA
ncbi:MAG: hypothetical protein JRN03_08865 [Nitrososphaerota archaeon]|nr:hypothetical protein [Nitrososphaerota archaeon]